MTEPTGAAFSHAIRTQAELERFWRTLMGPLGFSGRSVWAVLIDADDRPTPVITKIEEFDTPPAPEDAGLLASMLQTVLDDAAPGGRWALLRSRPGHGGVTDTDREFAAAVLGPCRAAGLPVDVLHLATDDELVPLAPDDLAA